jgi:hypothetical protein
MTLIVGILCQDGIVVGADGAATMGALGQSTARQSVKKLSLLTSPLPMVIGVSGPMGMSQKITNVFSKINLSGRSGSPPNPVEAMVTIRNQLWTECIQPEVKIAVEAQKLFGNISNSDANCACIAALPVSRQLTLINFNQQGTPELATKDLPFVAIGSGQYCADPFLAFLRRIFWPDRQPKLAEGIFATWWTLDQAIKTSPGGIAEPKQIAILEMNGNTPVCRELPQGEIDLHKEAVTNAESHLRGFNQPTPNLGDIPAPPA